MVRNRNPGAYSVGGKSITSRKDVDQVTKVTSLEYFDGSLSYYDKGIRWRLNNRFLTTGNNVWYYFKR